MTTTLRPYAEYQETRHPWLGMIPSHWEASRLKHAAWINPGRAKASRFLSDDCPVTFLPMEKVGTDGRIDPRELRPISTVWNGFTFFQRDDVIVAKITPCFENGKGACLDDLPTPIGFGSTEFIVVRSLGAMLPRYLYRITTLSEFRVRGADAMTGSAGQQRVPTSFIENYVVAIPPLQEQAAIVRFLNHADQKFRRFIQAKRRLIELLNEQRKFAISRILTGGIDSDVGLKATGLTWPEEIPEHWTIRRLKRIAKFQSGDGITSLSINPEGEFPVYGGNGLRGYTDHFTHNGDYVLIGRQGALCGNVHLVSGQFWASEHAVVATLGHQIDWRWFGEVIRLMNLNQYSQSAAQPGLSFERIRELKTAVPPHSEQVEIMRQVALAGREITSSISLAETEIALVREYRTRLIADVVSGKLDVREAAERLPSSVEEVVPDDDLLGLSNSDSEEADDLDDDAPELLSVTTDEG